MTYYTSRIWQTGSDKKSSFKSKDGRSGLFSRFKSSSSLWVNSSNIFRHMFTCSCSFSVSIVTFPFPLCFLRVREEIVVGRSLLCVRRIG